MEAQRIRGIPPKLETAGAAPPAEVGPKTLDQPEPAPRLWQFNLAHPELNATVSVTVWAADIRNARGLAYLAAESFYQQVIGQIRAESAGQ